MIKMMWLETELQALSEIRIGSISEKQSLGSKSSQQYEYDTVS